METFHELLSTNLERDPGRIAVLDGRRDPTTFEDVEREVARAARWLVDAGVGPGDRVCVHLPKGIEEIAALFATSRIGAVFVDVSRHWTASQLRHVLDDSGASALFTDGRRARELVEDGGLPPGLRVVASREAPEHPDVDPWSSLSGDAPAVPRGAEDLAALIYTSGSTGRPKGVVLTHRNLVLGARSVARYLGNRADDRVLALLPFSFDYGLSQLTTSWLVGGAIVLLRAMMPTEIVRTMLEHRVTGLPALPSIWIPLVRHLREQPTSFPDLRYLTNTGGAIPPPTLRALPEVFPGAEIFLMYGQTEAFRSTFLAPEKFARKMGSIGSAIPNVETFVVDAERGRCGPGEVGELVHRGPLVSRGYWNRPEETDAAIRSCPQLADVLGDEKVLFTGDLVRLDEEGDLWFVGRRDDLVKTSGYRVSPTEVEDVVAEHEQVRQVVALGVPDDELGERIAVVVSTHGGELDPELLLRHCRERLPMYMIPRQIHPWVGEIPRTAHGKPDRALLRELSLRPGPRDD